MPITTRSRSRQVMEQPPSQLGARTSDPQLNPNLGVNPTMSESVPINFDLLNLIVSEETIVNQPNEINVPINLINQFLSNLRNTQMVDDIIKI